MQTQAPPSLLCRLTAALCLASLVAACTAGDQQLSPAETSTPDAVLESRAALGGPTVQLGEAVIGLAEDLAAARYEVPRGPGMRESLRGVRDSVEAVRDAAGAAEGAAQEALVPQAVQIVRDAVEQAVMAADAAENEVGYLRRVSGVDLRLLRIAQLWDEPGSQSEIRSRLDAAAAQAARTRRRARALQPAPQGCRVMKRNRIAWAATVRTRTQRLRSQANSAGGGEFDDLRAAYRRLPLGVEPRSADQQERQCWRDASAVWGAADELRASVEALEAALQ